MTDVARDPDCTCRQEYGDSRCVVHDGDRELDAPPAILSWRSFLRRVMMRGPIPMHHRITRWGADTDENDGLAYVFQTAMWVPDREIGEVGANLIIVRFQNTVPIAHDDALKIVCVRQRVLGAFQHEALEGIFLDGARAFDPHAERWYSQLVADWRFNV